MNHNTYHVLVAEDEPLILHNIAKKIEKCSAELQIVGKVQNGEEALDVLSTTSVDILVTDIEMPGMNGLDLIRCVREMYPSIHIVILSGYSNFEYARSALRYGVDDYLLKPIDQESLNQILQGLCLKLKEEQRFSSRNVLSFALNHSSNEQPSFQDTNQLPSALHDGSFFLIHITLGNISTGTHLLQSSSNQAFGEIWEKLPFKQCFKNSSFLDRFWLIDEKAASQKFLILHIEPDNTTLNYYLLLLKKFLSEQLQDFPYLILTYYTPISYRKLWEKAEFLRSSVNNWSYPFCQNTFVLSEDIPLPEQEPANIMEAFNLLFVQHTQESFMQVLHTTIKKIILYPTPLLCHCLHLIYEAASSVFHADKQECTLEKNTILNSLPMLKTPEDFYAAIDSSLSELAMKNTVLTDSTTLSLRLKEYIELNFKEQISLTELSDTFGYTPSYINRIFKKDYGLSPLQYLTNLRICRAKDLLNQNPDINIYTVSESVGYSDPRYFSRIFKNEMGMSPSEWIQAQKKSP